MSELLADTLVIHNEEKNWLIVHQAIVSLQIELEEPSVITMRCPKPNNEGWLNLRYLYAEHDFQSTPLMITLYLPEAAVMSVDEVRYPISNSITFWPILPQQVIQAIDITNTQEQKLNWLGENCIFDQFDRPIDPTAPLITRRGIMH